jgi:hypothetical protein
VNYAVTLLVAFADGREYRLKLRLDEMGARVLHDTATDNLHLSEMYHRQHIDTYSRAEFLARWCGIEEYLPAVTSSLLLS